MFAENVDVRFQNNDEESTLRVVRYNYAGFGRGENYSRYLEASRRDINPGNGYTYTEDIDNLKDGSVYFNVMYKDATKNMGLSTNISFGNMLEYWRNPVSKKDLYSLATNISINVMRGLMGKATYTTGRNAALLRQNIDEEAEREFFGVN